MIGKVARMICTLALLNATWEFYGPVLWVEAKRHRDDKDNKYEVAKRDDSDAQEIVRRYDQGIRDVDGHELAFTLAELYENLEEAGYKRSYACQDFGICVDPGEMTHGGKLDEGKYYKAMFDALFEKVLEVAANNDKSVLTIEKHLALAREGSYSIASLGSSIAGSVKGIVNHGILGAGSRSVRDINKKIRKDSKHNEDAYLEKMEEQCSGDRAYSRACKEFKKADSRGYNHYETMSHVGFRINMDIRADLDHIIDYDA